MAHSDTALPEHLTEKKYAYPGGTLHLAPLAWYGAGLTFIWLIYYQGGLQAFRTAQGLGLISFGIFLGFVGIVSDWAFRSHVGQIAVTQNGLICSLPWRRRRKFRWEDIRQVRRSSRGLHPEIYAWEIYGPASSDRVIFTWELKGHKELLRTIQQRATHCEHFDSIE
jgi:hypothetical protein